MMEISWIILTVIFHLTAIEANSDPDERFGNRICPGQDVVYLCDSNETITYWTTIFQNGTQNDPVIFHQGDNTLMSYKVRNTDFVATLLQKNPHMRSQLVIPYNESKWNGTTIKCYSEPSRYLKVHHYIIADLPSSPTLSENNVTVTEQMLKLQWDIAECAMDYSTIMISVNGTNTLNISCLTGSAIMDVSEYPSGATIQIEAYGVNQCDMVSNPTILTKELNSNKSTVTVNDCTEEISISVGGTIGVLVVLLVVVVLIYFCYWYTNKCSCKLESGQ